MAVAFYYVASEADLANVTPAPNLNDVAQCPSEGYVWIYGPSGWVIKYDNIVYGWNSVVGSIPAGLITLWYGLLSAIPSGWLLCDGTNGTPDLRDKFVKGAAAGIDPGLTGGASMHTPTGTVAAPVFSGSSATSSAVSAGTPAGTNSTATVTPLGSNASTTLTPLGTVAAPVVSWPVGVPTATGSAVADHAAHTHTFAASANTASPKLTTVNTSTGQAASGTTGNPSAVLTHNVTQPTLAWPAGVPTATAPAFSGSSTTVPAQTFTGQSSTVAAPTFTGSALGTHQHTVTATGTNSAPAFTGTEANYEPAYLTLAYLMKAA